MSASVLYMSMSLDGYIAGPDSSAANYPLVTYATDGIISAMAPAKAVRR